MTFEHNFGMNTSQPYEPSKLISISHKDAVTALLNSLGCDTEKGPKIPDEDIKYLQTFFIAGLSMYIDGFPEETRFTTHVDTPIFQFNLDEYLNERITRIHHQLNHRGYSRYQCDFSIERVVMENFGLRDFIIRFGLDPECVRIFHSQDSRTLIYAIKIELHESLGTLANLALAYLDVLIKEEQLKAEAKAMHEIHDGIKWMRGALEAYNFSQVIPEVTTELAVMKEMLRDMSGTLQALNKPKAPTTRKRKPKPTEEVKDEPKE